MRKKGFFCFLCDRVGAEGLDGEGVGTVRFCGYSWFCPFWVTLVRKTSAICSLQEMTGSM